MAIEVSWDNAERTCLRYTLEGSWSLADLRDVRGEMQALLEQGPACNSIIVDLTHSKFVPQNFMRHFGKMGYRKVPNVECMIFVGSNKYMAMLVKTFQRTYKNESLVWELADDMTEARTIAAQFADRQPVMVAAD